MCVRVSVCCFSWAQHLLQGILGDTLSRAGHEIRCWAQREDNLLWVVLTVSAKKKKENHERKKLTTLSLQKRVLTTSQYKCLPFFRLYIIFVQALWDFKTIFCFFDVITCKPLSKNHRSECGGGVPGRGINKSWSLHTTNFLIFR